MFRRAKFVSLLLALIVIVVWCSEIQTASDMPAVMQAVPPAAAAARRSAAPPSRTPILSTPRPMVPTPSPTLAPPTPVPPTPVPPPQFDPLRQQVAALAPQWDGVVGFYLYDLRSGTEMGLNENTVFSGASLMKIAIMLQVYITLPAFTPDQDAWLNLMLNYSDNNAANTLLAEIGPGDANDIAEMLVALRQMNQTLRDLDLGISFQSLPYELPVPGELLTDEVYQAPDYDGPEPRTYADPVIRTTPREIGRLLTYIVQCSQGKGQLPQRFPQTLTPERCGEMLERMRNTVDEIRIVAGLPPGTRIAHKSGWIDDMQGSVGYVESPGGDFVVAILLYRPPNEWEGYLSDGLAGPAIAAYSRATYSFYNPSWPAVEPAPAEPAPEEAPAVEPVPVEGVPAEAPAVEPPPAEPVPEAAPAESVPEDEPADPTP